MTEPITIGVDHGYAAMKTAHCSFPSGLAEYEHEPYTQKNVLCYDGKYYVVGSGRQPIQKDKTADENYYLLTLAAFAVLALYSGQRGRRGWKYFFYAFYPAHFLVLLWIGKWIAAQSL